MARVQFTKRGLKYDYVGAHVTWTIKGRTYLGEVVSTYRRECPQAIMFKVRHFNGEDAPDVAASYVKVLERSYDSDSDRPLDRDDS